MKRIDSNPNESNKKRKLEFETPIHDLNLDIWTVICSYVDYYEWANRLLKIGNKTLYDYFKSSQVMSVIIWIIGYSNADIDSPFTKYKISGQHIRMLRVDYHHVDELYGYADTTRWTDKMLALLKLVPNLEYLELHTTTIILPSMMHLKRIIFSDAGIKIMGDNSLPALEYVSISIDQVDFEDFDSVIRCPNIKRIDVLYEPLDNMSMSDKCSRRILNVIDKITEQLNIQDIHISFTLWYLVCEYHRKSKGGLIQYNDFIKQVDSFMKRVENGRLKVLKSKHASEVCLGIQNEINGLQKSHDNYKRFEK